MKDYKWTSKEQSKKLNEIMQILEPYYTEYLVNNSYRLIIIPDNYKNLVDNKLLVGLSKPFYQYKNGYCKMELESEYLARKKRYEEQQKKEEEQRKKEQEELEKRNEIIEDLKKNFNGEWKDKEWIEKNIGIYEPWDNVYEYFWSLIGNNWKVKDWKYNIQLEVRTLEKIQDIKNNGINGRKFLRTKYKNSKGYKANIEEKGYLEIEYPDSFGVYGIYIEDELVYIGSTIRPFEVRFEEHRQNVKNGSNELSLYQYLREAKKNEYEVTFRVLINCGKIETNKKFDIVDVESMELALITYFQPKYNIAGIKMPFRYKLD